MRYRVFIFIFLLFGFVPSFGGEKLVKTVYSNGLTVLYKETEGKGILSGSIFIKGGSYEDTVEKAGLTNLTLKLLLQGSKNYSSFDINKFFEDSGGFISSSTSEDFSNIDFSVKVEDFEKAVDIILDILQNPIFPEDKFIQERTNIVYQIKAKKEEGFSAAFDELRKIIYKDTNYQYSPLGSEETLNKITIEDVKNRWDKLLNSKRIVVSIVGDLPYKKAEKILRKFSHIKSGQDFEFPVLNQTINESSCVYVQREGQQSTILIAYDAPTLLSKDYFSFRVLNGVLGSGFTSRLFQELREKRGLAYAVGSFFPARLNIGTVVAYIGTDVKKTEESEKGIREVVDKLKEGIKKEEIATSKEKIIGTFLMDHQTRSKQAYYLGWYETVGLGYKMDKDFSNIVRKITQKDVENIIGKYFKKNACVIVKP